jgi:hypothetical protein
MQLSIVLGTTHPWPAAKGCLDALAPQCEAGRVEVVVADSCGVGLPDPSPYGPDRVRRISVPGASIFELRARATDAAAGSIVAWTEDHCQPAPDFCQRILESHGNGQRAELVAGVVTNGAVESLMDWANFLCTFGPFVPPLNPSKIGRVPPAATISFHRAELPPGPLAPGFVELIWERQVWGERKIRYDQRIAVKHIQSYGFWRTPVVHFHNGRSTAGMFAKRSGIFKRLLRMAVCVALPAEILRTAVRPLLGKPGIPLLRSLPLMVMLAISHSAGEFTGLLFGSAGNSPMNLE